MSGGDLCTRLGGKHVVVASLLHSPDCCPAMLGNGCVIGRVYGLDLAPPPVHVHWHMQNSHFHLDQQPLSFL